MRDDHHEIVADLLYQYRIEHELNIEDIAKITGISLNVLNNVRRCKSISAYTVYQLSKTLSPIFEPYIHYQTCIICGEKFVPIKSNIKTCSNECSKKNRQGKQNNWNAQLRIEHEKSKKDPTRNNKIWPMPTKQKAEDFERLSREEGMTYGQRQALERLGQLPKKPKIICEHMIWDI